MGAAATVGGVAAGDPRASVTLPELQGEAIAQLRLLCHFKEADGTGAGREGFGLDAGAGHLGDGAVFIRGVIGPEFNRKGLASP